MNISTSSSLSSIQNKKMQTLTHINEDHSDLVLLVARYLLGLDVVKAMLTNVYIDEIYISGRSDSGQLLTAAIPLETFHTPDSAIWGTLLSVLSRARLDMPPGYPLTKAEQNLL